MKNYQKTFKVFLMFIFLTFFFVACVPKGGHETETGKDLSEEFSKVYIILDTTKEFYEQSKPVIIKAGNEGYLNEEQKEKVKTIAKNYVRLHNLAQSYVDNWYNAVNSGQVEDGVEHKEVAFETLYDLIMKGEMLIKVFEEATGGEFKLPEGMLTNTMELVNTFSEISFNKE